MNTEIWQSVHQKSGEAGLTEVSPALRPSQCKVYEITEEAEWHAHFSRVPFATFSQCWAYGEAKRAQGRNVRRLLIEANGVPIALCQVLKVQKLGVPLAARIDRGPLFFSSQPSADEARAVFRAIRRACCFPRGGVLLIAPAIKAGDGTVPPMLGYRRRSKHGWRSALVDLRKDVGELRKQLDQKWRNSLNKALKSPLALHLPGGTQELDWLIGRHEEHMGEKGFIAHGGGFLRALAAAAPSDIIVARAMLNGEPVSGMLLVRFGLFAEYFIGWNGDNGRKHNAGNLLLWHGMLEMKQRGCAWFDLGGYETGEGFGHFKAGVRGEVYQLAGEWVTI